MHYFKYMSQTQVASDFVFHVVKMALHMKTVKDNANHHVTPNTLGQNLLETQTRTARIVHRLSKSILY